MWFSINKKKNIIVAFLLVVIAGVFSACTVLPEDVFKDVSTNTFTINEDGTIREIAIEDFAGVSYDYSGLKDMITADVENYCLKNGEGSIVLVKFKDKNGLVKVCLDYKSLEDYNNFNGTSYYINDANEISKKVKLNDRYGNEIRLADITVDGYKAIHMDGKLSLTVNGEILYYNSHATIGADSSTVTLDGTGYGVVIYK